MWSFKLRKRCCITTFFLSISFTKIKAMSIPCGIPFVSTNCKARVDRRYDTSIKFDLEWWESSNNNCLSTYRQRNFEANVELSQRHWYRMECISKGIISQHNHSKFEIVDPQKISFAKDNFGNRPGFLNAVDEYYTSSHEKNGVAFLVAYSTGVVGHSSQLQLLPRGSLRIEPSSNITAIFQHDTSQVEYIDTPDLTF